MNPDWAREIRDQCRQAGTAFFFKQWGDFIPVETPHGRAVQRVGKKQAGRLLDGVTHDAMPGVRS